MAKQMTFKQEHYTAVADFIAVSFERDLSDFSNVFKTMNDSYLEKFKQAIESAKNSVSATELKMKQKEATKKLYETSKELSDIVLLLKKYAKRANVDVSMLQETVNQLKARNVETPIKTLRDALPYLTSVANKLEDMPDNFLDKILPLVTSLENLNTEQNKLMNEGKKISNERKPIYKNLYKYISEIAEAGKIIYKDSYKKSEYTISKILARVQSKQVNVKDKV
ncbi:MULTISPECIES: hypothetical protein [Capnocytophaga]|uniref:Uncharacterized protein n=4 Tax=Capnocytophaga TaxID=1016 RepID=A0A250EAM5_9FLAO|nr:MULTISPECIES: hypothetical protein [Capnocytophaga]AEK23680.1 Conserved hypothetical protein [Capnocytophaga canimorsus Cc5]ATA68788.1 hypothetical protein CGC48_09205 [Capnocytophaga cynodegmi]ATA91299.1 hypothetical protein CGC56_03425 [Capnocytophaga canimorsus]WGU70719.1 hypothetical protein QIU18_00835 [Capnocytophaga canimorsus]GIM55321.1 hypothetical protein CAPN005_19680 [Capnocytophaga cynodegmi]